MSRELPFQTKKMNTGKITNIQILIDLGVPITRIAKRTPKLSRQTIHNWIKEGILTKV